MYSPEQEKSHIYELQQMLYIISLRNSAVPGIVPDSIYGKETADAVRKFQQQYGLRVTGEVNSATWEKAADVSRELGDLHPKPLEAFPEEPDSVLHEGEHSFSVLIVQAILLALSERVDVIPPCRVTGDFDHETTLALQPFQKICALPVTGSVDKVTWSMLAEAGAAMR